MAPRKRRRNPASLSDHPLSESLALGHIEKNLVQALPRIPNRGPTADAWSRVNASVYWIRELQGQVRHGVHVNPRKGRKGSRKTSAARRRPNPTRKRSRAGELLAFTVKRGAKAVGVVTARTAQAAAREAKAAGLELGRAVKAEFCRNPPQGAVLSRRAEAITYQHADDGEWYRHRWAPGVVVKVARDRKSVKLYRPDGKPVAGNFDVP